MVAAYSGPSMLWFERKVVATLTRDIDDPYRSRVVEYVDAALRSMPEYLRAGVAAESIVLGALPRAREAMGGFDDAAVHRWLAMLESSPIDPVRQYVRLLSSLVLFAHEELVPEPAR
jgi:hypothetical protein